MVMKWIGKDEIDIQANWIGLKLESLKGPERRRIRVFDNIIEKRKYLEVKTEVQYTEVEWRECFRKYVSPKMGN